MMQYTYQATVVRVVDGDTVYLELTKDFFHDIDFGFYVKETIVSKKSTVLDFRLKGINTPEIRGATREAGLAAKAELERLLSLGQIKATTYRPDKYGRWLAILEVLLPDGTILNVNDDLVRRGFAVPYMVED